MSVALRQLDLKAIGRADGSPARDWGVGRCVFCESKTSRYSEPVDVGQGDELRVRVCGRCADPRHPLVPEGWLPHSPEGYWVPELGEDADAARAAFEAELSEDAAWRRPVPTKVCTACDRDLPLDAYYVKVTQKSTGRAARCKECASADTSARRRAKRAAGGFAACTRCSREGRVEKMTGGLCAWCQRSVRRGARTAAERAEIQELLARGLRECPACREVKPLDAYGKGKSPGGVQARCKACRMVEGQERWRRMTPDERAIHCATPAERRELRRKQAERTAWRERYLAREREQVERAKAEAA